MVQVGGVVMFSITWTTYNTVSVHGSRRLCYNGAAVYYFRGAIILVEIRKIIIKIQF